MKIIKINGKRVRCRALKRGDIITEGDVFLTGEGAEEGFLGEEEWEDEDSSTCFYRPIPAKPKKVKLWGSFTLNSKKPAAKGKVKSVKPRISFERELDSQGAAHFQLPMEDLHKLWPLGTPAPYRRTVRITITPTQRKAGR